MRNLIRHPVGAFVLRPLLGSGGGKAAACDFQSDWLNPPAGAPGCFLWLAWLLQDHLSQEAWLELVQAAWGKGLW